MFAAVCAAARQRLARSGLATRVKQTPRKMYSKARRAGARSTPRRWSVLRAARTRWSRSASIEPELAPRPEWLRSLANPVFLLTEFAGIVAQAVTPAVVPDALPPT